MVITKDWLVAWSVGGGGSGWSPEQMEILGVRPTKGWLKRLIGTELPDDKRSAFEAAATTTHPSERHAALANTLRSARRRLGIPGASKAVTAARIRAEYEDAPEKGSAARVLAWYSVNVVHVEPFCAPARSERRRVADADGFLGSYAWRRLRMEVIKERGRRCECCGASPADGTTVINVDHVKPRRFYPELALDKANLQVLCAVCNHGKGNWDETDWRRGQPAAASTTMLQPGIAAGAEAADWTIQGMLRPVRIRSRKASRGALARRASAVPRLVKSNKLADS